MTESSSLTLRLLADALQQTLANPSAIHRWHTLLERVCGDVPLQIRSEVFQRLLAEDWQNSEWQFFRASFLAAVVRDKQYRIQAGKTVLQISPVDVERLMAFTVFEWGKTLTQGGGRAEFVQTVSALCLPEINQRMAQQIARFVSLPARPVTQLQKVALIAPFLGSAKHPPTQSAFQLARLLQEQGKQVRLFTAQDCILPNMHQYLANNGVCLLKPPATADLQAQISSGLAVTLADSNFSLLQRYVDIGVDIAQFDPDLIVFVGFNSPLVSALYASRPVLALCSQSVSPLAAVDVWLTAQQAYAAQQSDDWTPIIPAALGHYHPYRIQLKPSGEHVPRSHWGLPEQGLVLVSVGARLQYEIGGAWATRMLAFLQQHPQLTWLLVGGEGLVPEAVAGCAALKILPFQSDIRSVLRCCDIYVNPNRLGGGFSVAEAMAEGLPTLALRDSDGGNKLDQYAADDLDAYFAQLDALVRNPALRASHGVLMQQQFKQKLDIAASGPSLQTACELAWAQFRVRVSF